VNLWRIKKEAELRGIKPKEIKKAYCFVSLIKRLKMTTKENILHQLKLRRPELSKFGISAIGLFGSYVRNEQSEKSDIDLLVDFKPDQENFDNYMAIYDMFEEVFKNEKIEMVTKNGLSPYIGPKILNEVIYV
jgi:predicted nucleotidyltransferase